MSDSRAALFRTVPVQNTLGFWTDDTFNSDEVVRFLDFKKADVAKITGVSPASVRFDHKIPKEVAERLMEIAAVCELVAQYFSGNVQKTVLWFKTNNPLLGNVSPRDMIRLGRYSKLQRFVMEALEEDASIPSSDTASTTREALVATPAYS